MKRPMKKLIYLEMIVLSVLLVVAVVIASKSANKTEDWSASSKQDSTQQTSAQQKPSWKTFPEDRQLTAKQYFVFDCKKQNFLTLSGDENQRVYPADITKLFTAYTIMATTAIGSDAYCVAGDELDLVADNAPIAHIEKGDKLSAMQLMEGMLLCNGSDAAYILACQAGRNLAGDLAMPAAEAVQIFVGEMNRVAQESGMMNTNFVNPDGTHDPNHYTTPHDLVIWGNLSMQFNSIKNPVVTPKAEITLRDETVLWQNANLLINPESEYYCPYAMGLKTGQTPDAGSCILSAFNKDGQYLLIGVFGCPEDNACFDDTLQLFNQIVLK